MRVQTETEPKKHWESLTGVGTRTREARAGAAQAIGLVDRPHMMKSKLLKWINLYYMLLRVQKLRSGIWSGWVHTSI